MRNKGIVIVTAVLLTLTCLFYLSFPIATNYYDNQAAKIKDPIDQQNYKDSVKYLGIYDYQKCLQTQIGLGLDLKGGMNVVLEISVPDVVDMLADHKTEPAFVKSMNEARQQLEAGKSDFISLTTRTPPDTTSPRYLPHSSCKARCRPQAQTAKWRRCSVAR